MRIRSFHLEDFGVLHNVAIDKLPPHFAIFLGRNEAGKSTLLNFFRCMLLGYPQKKADQAKFFANGRGGSLLVETEGGLIRVSRSPGKNGGLRLSDDKGNLLPPALWEQFFAGVDREVYNSVYGFSLSELQSFASLDSDGVKQSLYGASFGMGLNPPGEVINDLTKKMADIFTVKGTKPNLSEAMIDLENTCNEITEAGKSLEEYDRLALQVEEEQKKLAQLQQESVQLEKEDRSLERRINVYNQWDRWRSTCLQLKGLEPIAKTFPQDGLSRLTRVLERQESTTRDFDIASKHCKELQEELEKIHLDTELLNAADEIASLSEGKTSCRNALIDIPGIEQNLVRSENDIQQELSRLGEGWTLDRVLAVDRPLSLRQEVESFSESLHNALAAKEEADHRMERSEQEENEATQALEDAKQHYESLPTPVAELAGEDREELRKALERTEEARHRLPEREKAQENARHEYNRAINAVHIAPRQATIETLNALSAAQEEIRQLASEVSKQDVALHDAERLAEQARDEELRSHERLERLQNEREGLGNSDRETLDDSRRMFRSLRNLLLNLPHEKDQLTDAEDQLHSHLTSKVKSNRNIFLLILGLLLALPGGIVLIAYYVLHLPALTLSEDLVIPLTSWTGYFLLLVGLALAGAGIPRSSPEAKRYAEVEMQLRNRVEAAQNKIQETQEKIKQICLSLNLASPDFSGDETDDLLESLESKMDREREQCAAGERLDHVVADHEDELQKLRQRTQNLESDYLRLSPLAQQAKRQWHERVMGMGVQNVPTPDQVEAFLGKVEAARLLWSTMTDLEKEVAEMERQGVDLAEIANRLLPQSAWLDSEDPSDPESAVAAVTRVLESCRMADQAAEDRSRAAGDVHAAEVRVERATKSKEESSEHLAETEKSLAVARTDWESCLQKVNLDTSFSPAMASQALESMDRILALVRERDHQNDELARRERERDALLLPLRALLDHLKRTPENEIQEADLLTLLDKLRQECEVEKSKAESKKNLETRCAEQEYQVRQTESMMIDAKKSVDSLLQMAEASDEEDFRHKESIRCERDRLIQEQQTLEATLRVTASDMIRLEKGSTENEYVDEEAFQTFLQGFVETEKENRITRQNEIKDRLATLATEEKDMAEQLRSSEVRMATLATSDRLAELRIKESTTREKIRELTREWSRYAMAKHLLEEAKKQFEQKRQPEVIRRASSIFSEITKGRWQTVVASLEKNSLCVLSKTCKSAEPETLSRGTQEQLYLALRLAHIRSHAAHATPLPIIMDDVLVNFDPERVKTTAKVFSDFCQPEKNFAGHQILFFTCHPYIAEILQEEVSGSLLYTLESSESGRTEIKKIEGKSLRDQF